MAQSEALQRAATENWDAYCRARDAGHTTYVELAEKCDRFYRGGGEQWEEEDRQALESEGRPALEINLVLSTVNAMLGEHAAQRAEIAYKPRTNASDDTAAAFTALAMYVQDENRYEHVEAQVVADGLIQDRGYFDVRMDFDNNIQGDIRITSEDPTQIVLDPEAKDYDPRTWNQVIKSRWMTLDEVEAQYGKKHRDELESRFYGGTSTYGVDSVMWESKGTTFGDTDQALYYSGSTDDTVVRGVRVLERQYRKLGWQSFFVDQQTGDMRAIADDVSEARAKQIATALGMSVIRKMVNRVRWCVSCDDYTIHDEWSPYRSFTIVPYFPYFRRGRPFGVVRNLISPQEQLNKIESQSLHVINTTANSGWVLEAGSLQNMTTEELEARGAETGLVLVYRSGKEPPAKIQPNQIPTGLDQAAQKSALHIKTISGVNDAMLGSESPEVSGVAMNTKLRRGSTQLQVPFSNLAYTRLLLGEIMYELFRDYYTEARTFQVIDFKDTQQREKQVAINQPQPDGSILNDVLAGNYRVVVSSQPARDSFMETQFAEALSMRDAGVMVPDDIVIENSHLHRKNEIAERVRKLQGMSEPTPEEAQVLQMQQEMMMRTAMAQLAELEAKAQNLQAQAMLAQAKAGNVASETELAAKDSQAELMLEIQTLKQDWAKKLLDLQSKMQLAQVHTEAKTQQTMYTTTANRFLEELKMSHQARGQAFDSMVEMAIAKEKSRVEAQKAAMQRQKAAAGSVSKKKPK